MTDDWNPNDPDAILVHYDLSRWTFDQQAELSSDLADAAVPHSWDGPELVVPEASEAMVDDLIAAVEERLGIVDDPEEGDEIPEGAEDPQPIELGEDIITTEYDLGEWTDDERATVGLLLINQHLAMRWDGHLLNVATDDEAAVEAVLDDVESGRVTLADVKGPGAGELPFETLTTFFLAGERLQKNALDADGLEQLLKALDVAEPANPPYGVERHLWERTCRLADELADALVGGDDPDQEVASEVAAELHDLLRPYV